MRFGLRCRRIPRMSESTEERPGCLVRLLRWAFGLAFSLVLLALLVVGPAAIDMWLSGNEFIERMRMPAWRMTYSMATYSFSFIVLMKHMVKVEAKARGQRLK